MSSQAVEELRSKLLTLNDISYDSIDKLMRKIMKSKNLTAKELHNAFKNKYKKTPDDWIKEKMKNLKEDHKEIASGKKLDDEGYMAKTELDSIEKAIKSLRKSIKSGNQQLPSWVQSKITKASDYIDTASEYLESDQEIDEEKNRIPGTKILTSTGSQIRPRTGARALSPEAAKSLGPKATELRKRELEKVNLPLINKEEISLVEKILGEEKCGKGMYWCNTDQMCKPLQKNLKKGMVGEEKDPKGPTKSYKSPQEIAKKHGVPLSKIEKQLKMGTKIEFEHTTSKNDARITALQHLDELPDYYSKLKKIETQKESSTIRDANGNYYAEFIDIIKSGNIRDENPTWKESEEKSVNESTTISSKTGNNIFVTLSWRGKYHTIQIFFPQSKVPSRLEISDEIQKIYPGSRVISYRVSELKQGEPLIYAFKGGSGAKLGPNKNYVKPMGEEVEISEVKKK